MVLQSYVICEPSAAQTIKSYSPNLMVSPLLRSTSTQALVKEDQSIEQMTSPILDLLPRLHVLVIGPGLGRDRVTLKQVAAVIKAARSQDPPVPIVLDADGLFLVNSDPDLIKGYKECILTPNVVEFGRLAKSQGVDVNDGDRTKMCEKLAKALGGVCIIQKGESDYISNGEGTTTCNFRGGLKRSGGQGDTLTGSLGTFLAWRQVYHEGLWDTSGKKMSRAESLLAVAFGGSAITRECSRKAFEKNGRALQASDLTEEVHGSFLTLIGEPEASKL
jgi:ATP-dependent NAD(P)H-hydrate dehydratase